MHTFCTLWCTLFAHFGAHFCTLLCTLLCTLFAHFILHDRCNKTIYLCVAHFCTLFAPFCTVCLVHCSMFLFPVIAIFILANVVALGLPVIAATSILSTCVFYFRVSFGQLRSNLHRLVLMTASVTTEELLEKHEILERASANSLLESEESHHE